jgi:hypothetical protein
MNSGSKFCEKLFTTILRKIFGETFAQNIWRNFCAKFLAKLLAKRLAKLPNQTVGLSGFYEFVFTVICRKTSIIN